MDRLYNYLCKLWSLNSPILCPVPTHLPQSQTKKRRSHEFIAFGIPSSYAPRDLVPPCWWLFEYETRYETGVKPVDVKQSNCSFFDLKPSPHYAEWISKRRFVSTIRPSAHSNPSRKRRFSNRKVFENAGVAFKCAWKTFWKRSFFLNTNPKWPAIVAF